MEQLQLNDPGSDLYKPFRGSHTRRMPNIVAGGLYLIPIQGIMHRQIEVLAASNTAVRDAWWRYPLDGGDVLAYHPDHKIKVVLDYEPLRELSRDSEYEGRFRGRGLILEDGMYEQLEGLELKGDEIEKYVKLLMTKDETKTNPIFRFLSRDVPLLNEHTDGVDSRQKGYMGGIYIGPFEEVPVIRGWSLGYGLRASGPLNFESSTGCGTDISTRTRIVAVKDGVLEILKELYPPKSLEEMVHMALNP